MNDTPIRFWVDEFSVFRGVVFSVGWAEPCASDGVTCSFEVDGVRVAADIARIDRPDLHEAYGPGAERWGFIARAIFPGSVAHSIHRSVTQHISGGGKSLSIPNPGEFGAGKSAEAASSVWSQFLAEVDCSGQHVLELGSRARSGVVNRGRIERATYTGLDVLAGPNVDVVGDAHFLPKALHGKFSGAFSISTVEHLLMPWKVAAEINLVLRTGGLVLTQTHQTWTVHDAPWDFFRFSRDSWRGLFNEATGFRIERAIYSEPATVVALEQSRNEATRFDWERGFLASICLARKVGEPKQLYEMPRDLYDRIIGAAPYPA